MKELQLTRGYVALVDDDDFEWLNSYKWYAKIYKNNNIYAARTLYLGIENNKKKYHTQRIHHVILDIIDYKIIIDHKNGNSLDNRKENLRIATKQQNMANSKINKNNTKGYKGISLYKNGRWRAKIYIFKKVKYLGFYENAIEAAQAYNDAAVKYFGEFARLNVISNRDKSMFL